MSTTKTNNPVQIARDAVTTHKLELQRAKSRADEIQFAWLSGKSEIPASALVEARAEIERAEALVKAAEWQVTLAERARAAAEPELARSVAHALGDGLYGVAAQSSNATVPLENTDEPTVTLVQTRAEKADTIRGTISGQVTLVVTGPEYIAAPKIAAVKSLLKDDDIRLAQSVDPHVTEVKPGVFTVLLNIALAWALVPVIETDVAIEREAKNLGKLYLSRVAQANWSRSEGESFVGGSAVSELVNVEAKNGKRTVTVDVKILTTPKIPGVLDASAVVEKVKDYLTALNGTAMADLGRCTSVKNIQIHPAVTLPEGGGMAARTRFPVSARLTFLSKTAA